MVEVAVQVASTRLDLPSSASSAKSASIGPEMHVLEDEQKMDTGSDILDGRLDVETASNEEPMAGASRLGKTSLRRIEVA